MSPAHDTFLPYGYHAIDADDIDAVTAALRGRFLTGGQNVENFEQALAEKTGARHAVALANGTAALHVAALALNLGPGDAAIVPSMTFLATANAVRFTGAEVVFADVDPNTGLMSGDTLTRALKAVPGGSTAKAIFPVHLGGQTAALVEIADLARNQNLRVVEDACHAVGTTYEDHGQTHRVGACAHAEMAVFSFHPVKTIAMGEGGAVTTNSPEVAATLRLLRSHAMVPTQGRGDADDIADGLGERYPTHYEMHQLGFNYRASDIACALGLSQLNKLDAFVARRRQLVALYDKALAPLAPQVRPVGRVPGCHPGWHLYAVLIDFDGLGLKRSAVMKALTEQGIGSQVHYYPVHRQPYYRQRYGDLNLLGTVAYYKKCLSLPLFPAMADGDVDRVVSALGKVLS
jgi:UDP-4-amino-4,6-dideoxy-N-acetyl-beta-L-altrosamine transaminase